MDRSQGRDKKIEVKISNLPSMTTSCSTSCECCLMPFNKDPLWDKRENPKIVPTVSLAMSSMLIKQKIWQSFKLYVLMPWEKMVHHGYLQKSLHGLFDLHHTGRREIEGSKF